MSTVLGLEVILHCELAAVPNLLAAAWYSTRYNEARVTVWPDGRHAAVALCYLAYEGCEDDLDPDGERADHLAEALARLPIPYDHHIEDLSTWSVED